MFLSNIVKFFVDILYLALHWERGSVTVTLADLEIWAAAWLSRLRLRGSVTVTHADLKIWVEAWLSRLPFNWTSQTKIGAVTVTLAAKNRFIFE